MSARHNTVFHTHASKVVIVSCPKATETIDSSNSHNNAMGDVEEDTASKGITRGRLEVERCSSRERQWLEN